MAVPGGGAWGSPLPITTPLIYLEMYVTLRSSSKLERKGEKRDEGKAILFVTGFPSHLPNTDTEPFSFGTSN